ncbi:hypothetical protein D2Q93_02280 [Alicyclobacillaceae bacterium I2511]|nr:hypothetical protein D2Q93_02280 [Alicyclobacillaceae bacterium I2511]
MKERMKILELLSEGKITPEQAESLLSTVENKEESKNRWGIEKVSNLDLKSLGSQVSAAVSQSIGEVRRVVEQQFDNLPFWTSTVSVTHEVALPLEIRHVSLETVNGAVQIMSWDEPYVKVLVRAQVRTDSLAEGRNALLRAVQTNVMDTRYELAIVAGKRSQENSPQLIVAHLDIWLPRDMEEVFCRTHNGRVLAESIKLTSSLQAETANGSIHAFNVGANRIQLSSENGRVELRGLDPATSSVYLQSKNGSLLINGIPSQVACSGTAKTSFGRVDIDESQFELTAEEETRRNVVHFQRNLENHEGEIRFQLETRNGSIHLHA